MLQGIYLKVVKNQLKKMTEFDNHMDLHKYLVGMGVKIDVEQAKGIHEYLKQTNGELGKEEMDKISALLGQRLKK